MSQQQRACPVCGTAVAPHDSFCEACGADLAPTEAAAPVEEGQEVPVDLSTSVHSTAAAGPPPVEPAPRCTECGGTVGADGYCLTCGARARPPRDHFTAAPTSWVAGTCDRGLRHSRNEDAMALAAEDEPVRRAVLVVCDGVSTAPDSDRASMAAATAARDLLDAHRPAGLGTPESRAAALEATMVDGGQAAHQAVVAGSDPDSDSAPSCTFAAAVVEGDLCVWGLVGDSRVYWLPDDGPGEQLGVDDSVAAIRIAAGVEREVAESGAGAHAITRWLGSDSPDTMALTGSLRLDRPGWVLVCSDGLWNYVSPADRLHELLGRLAAAGHRNPSALAGALVDWANEQGGQDNITVALARVGDDLPEPGGLRHTEVHPTS